MELHKLLQRQLRRYCSHDPLATEHPSLFQAISDAYEQNEQAMQILEGSLYLTSKELNERNHLLRDRLLALGEAQDQLHRSLTALNAIFNATGEIIFSLDVQGRLLKSNKMGCELLPEIAAYEGSIKPIKWSTVERMLINSGHVKELMTRLSGRSDSHLTGTLHFTNGRIFEYHSLPQMQQQVLIGRVWCMRDVTDAKKNEEIIHHQAFHDALTGLPNRNLLLERIARSIETAPVLDHIIAIIFIDLDNFKKINDTEGHEAGDELLREASQRMRNCIREKDILARLGGDEFVVVIESGISQMALTRLCSHLLAAIAKPFQLNEHNHFVSCSMGISIYPRDDITPEGLIGKADMAMYRAKELGKNNFQFYSEELERLAFHQLEFECKLRDAIRNDEITIFMQPEVDLRTNKIVAAEALVRWIRPDGSMIPPDKFISIAEQCHLIGEIGRIVLSKVCAALANWQSLGLPPITVAVNLSAREFQDQGLIAGITNILAAYKVSAESIVLEITESLFMEDKENVLNTMNQLRLLGLRFAIDDFGTGYSSFSYLQDLPIQFLKVDRSFLKDVVHNKKRYAIARSIIDIGNHLELIVIAEGIEDQETLLFTKENHCTLAQGFYLYRPMAVPAITDLLSAQYLQAENKQYP